jgi:hypothetical protein
VIDETLTHHRIVSAPSPILEKNQVIQEWIAQGVGFSFQRHHIMRSNNILGSRVRVADGEGGTPCSCVLFA